MNKLDVQKSLEAKVAIELSSYLERVPLNSKFELPPSVDLCFLLELYVPQLLSHHYSEWQKESLDGIFTTSAQRTGSETVELGGMCILISDQTVTPFFIRLTLTPPRDSIASYKILLGEPGNGRLGISGPPCNSPHAKRLLETFNTRLGDIDWSYSSTVD